MAASPVRLDVEDGVATVLLNRPESSNAIDLSLAEALADATGTIGARDDIRVVVLRGAGRNFCVGGDVMAMASAPDRGTFIAELAELIHRSVRTLAGLDKPIISVVHGAAAGAGLSLVLSSDLVIASESARFLAAFGGVGLTPDSGTSSLLPKFVGLRRALELTLTGRTLSASEALDWGLITAVAPDAELDSAADALIGRVSSAAVVALGHTRRLMRASAEHSLDEQLDLERDSIADFVERREAVERMEAFLNKVAR